MFHLDMAIKLFSAFIVLIIYIKISGTGQLAPMTASDQVGNMVIGGLVGSTVVNQDISPWDSAIIVFMWAGLQLAVRFIKYRSPRVAQFLDGKKIALMAKGKFIPENFNKAKISVSDFLLLLQHDDVNDLSEIRDAWVDPSGTVTFDEKGQATQAILLIENGRVLEGNLKELDKDEAWLEEEAGIPIDEVFCALYYEDKLQVYPAK